MVHIEYNTIYCTSQTVKLKIILYMDTIKGKQSRHIKPDQIKLQRPEVPSFSERKEPSLRAARSLFTTFIQKNSDSLCTVVMA